MQWGFGMRASSAARRNGGQQPIQDGGAAGGASSGFEDVTPPDPNSHDFDPNAISTAAAIAAQQAAQQSSSSSASSSMSLGKGGSHDWIAYALMVVGWLILIKALTDFYKARKHEKLVLASPERGLNVAVVGEGERPEAVA